ncbi:MAG: IS66 family insertion sequence element accessory protein TnpB [Segetibacter sp.]|jgi:transposase|nr:IS66 family insertion sequence element accessory protein TnpB [Segetibacter sp.]
MLHLSAGCRYFLYSGNTDMRKGFDSLSGIVSSQKNEDVLSGSVFIFFNKKHNQVKLLLWEGDGFAMYYKRLEQGTYEVPAADNNNTSLSISSQQLQLILQGISLRSVRRRKRYQHRTQSSG